MNRLRRSLFLAFVALLSACAGTPMPGQATPPEAAPTGLGGPLALPDSLRASCQPGATPSMQPWPAPSYWR